MKKLLTKTPIRKVADPYKDYTICNDSSKKVWKEYYLMKDT